MAKIQTVVLNDSEYVILPKAEYLRLREAVGAPAGAVDAADFARGSLGRTLKSARQKAKLTQLALATLLKKSQPMVSGAENGTISVSDRYVASVLKACGLPKDWSGPRRKRAK